MTDFPTEATQALAAGRPAATIDEVEDALLSRWPETRLEPSLDRIQALVELLDDPQRTYRVIHLTGTNGKTSTARMIDQLLRTVGLRTGRFTSPHVERINERISVDGEPLDDEAFIRVFNDVAPYTLLVDADQPYPLSFFETVVGMAYAAFADAPADVAVIEVGMGGSWDATNVADGDVAVVTPIGLDHAQYLGSTPVAIAGEKAGIIKPGAVAVLASQEPDVRDVLLARAAEVGASVVEEGLDFGVVTRTAAVGGQIVTLRGLNRTYEDVFLGLYGAHQAQNAALALAAVESLLAQELAPDVVEEAFAEASSPGRLEIIRSNPTILLDAAHNPHGAEATAAALEDSFSFSGVVGVIGVMGDKDVEGVLVAFEPYLTHLVVTQNSQARSMRAEQVGEIAREVFGEDRVSVVPDLANAIEAALALAEEPSSDSISGEAVLITGSVVTVGEARALLKRKDPTALRGMRSMLPGQGGAHE